MSRNILLASGTAKVPINPVDPTGINATAGDIQYNSTDVKLKVYDTAWKNLATETWVNAAIAGGGGGGGSLATLSDVLLTGLGTGNFLRYDGTKWVNAMLVAADLGNVAILNQTTSPQTASYNINGTSTVSKITVNGSASSDSIAKFGSIEIQPYTLNNSWFSENVYYNGSSFIRRQAGFGELFYFVQGEGQFRFCNTGAAGSAIPEFQTGCVLKMNYSGMVALGGNVTTSVGNYSGAYAIFDSDRIQFNKTVVFPYNPSLPAVYNGGMIYRNDVKRFMVCDGTNWLFLTTTTTFATVEELVQAEVAKIKFPTTSRELVPTTTAQSYSGSSDVVIKDNMKAFYYDTPMPYINKKIYMPANPRDEQEVIISFGGLIMSGLVARNISILPNNDKQRMLGLNHPINVSAGDSLIFKYQSANSLWRKIG